MSLKDRGKKYVSKVLLVTLVMSYEKSSLIAGVQINIIHPVPWSILKTLKKLR